MPFVLATLNRRVILLALLIAAVTLTVFAVISALDPGHAQAAWLCYHNRWRC